MGSLTSVQLLNQLLALHSRSLPSYLASAPPWGGADGARALETLHHIAQDQQYLVDRIASAVSARGGVPDLGRYPMSFTSLHDLSLDHVLKSVVRLQSQAIDQIRSICDALADDPDAQAIGLEALGAAKGHLDSLHELESAAVA